jgi:hypothetical protein
MARDVFDLNCGQAGGAAVPVYPGQAIESDLLAREPAVPWIDVAGMRNHLVHRYFDTAHGIVQATLSEDSPTVVAAAKRLLDHLAVDLRHNRQCIRSSGSRHRRGRCPVFRAGGHRPQ